MIYKNKKRKYSKNLKLRSVILQQTKHRKKFKINYKYFSAIKIKSIDI